MLVKNIVLFVLLTISVIFQLTVLEYGVVERFAPDIVLVLIAFLSNFYGSLTVLIPAFLAGLVRDLLITTPMGMYAFLYTILCFLVGYTHQKLFVSSWFSAIALSFLTHWVQLTVLFCFFLIFRTERVFQSINFLEVLLEFLTGSILFVALFLVNSLRKNRNVLK